MTLDKTAKYQKLLAKRENVLNAIKHHKTKADGITINSTKNEILARVVQLEGSYERFQSIADELLDSDKYDEEDIKVSNEEITELYISAITKLKDAAQEDIAVALSSTRHQTSQSTSNIQDNIRLGKVPLRKFDGSPENWPTFYDSFSSMVDCNMNFSDNVKLHYHRDCLTGTALSLVAKLPTTDVNYRIAWRLLKDRFHNKRAIISAALTKFMNIPHLMHALAEPLRDFIDISRESLQCVESLDVSVDQWDAILVHIIESKLDMSTKIEWERFLKGATTVPAYSELMSFLETQHKILYSAEEHERKTRESLPSSKGNEYKPFRHMKSTIGAINSIQGKTERCAVCNEVHWMYFCPTFDNWSVKERWQFVKDTKRCVNCFKKHQDEICKSKYRCRICNGKHNTKLHMENSVSAYVGSESSTIQGDDLVYINTIHLENSTSKLLATAMVQVKDKCGVRHTMRAFIDLGAESTFITERAAQMLGSSSQREHVPLLGLNDIPLGNATKSMTIKINSIIDQDFVIVTKALISKKIIRIKPNNNKSIINCKHLRGIPLADPNFSSESNVDLLLGVDIYGVTITNGIRKGTEYEPVAQNTHFGWLVFGALSPTSNGIIKVNYTSLSQDLQRLWRNEEVEMKPVMSEEHNKCKQYYESTTKRHSDGHYTVSLPYNMDCNDENFLGNTYHLALKRQLSLERRFRSNTKLKEMYNAFMNEYLALGHMSLCENDSRDGCYLPHHAVVRENSTTTKLRTVFDGSAKSSNGFSLNDRLLNGPTIQPELFDTLIRWRINKVALNADIEKMYRQIEIAPSDRNNQKILYRFSEKDPMKTYYLNTITYGTKSAPYLAIETTFTLADNESKTYPIASKRIKTDMYVDDLLSGADTTSEAVELRRQCTGIFNAGHFVLRKWASNDETVLSEIPAEHRALQTPFELHQNDDIKTLGILWNPKTDKLYFKIDSSTLSSSKVITKRKLLSDGSKIYDPCGILSPITVKAKIMMQDTWKEGIDWDSNISNELQAQWNEYRSELHLLEKVEIDRWFFTTKRSKIWLHGFCDGSLKAFCAVIYLAQQTDEIMTSRIVCSKTKVAPIESESIPRIELCGAVMLFKLMKRVAKILNISKEFVHLWTDSEVVLTWLHAHPSRWEVYVANRVSKIQEEYNMSYWRYVPSHINPADIGSKGACASQLVNNALWFYGPKFITMNENNWPINKWTPVETSIGERKRVNVTCTPQTESEILTHFSKMNKLLRITALLLRFAHNTKQSTKDSPRKSPFVLPIEIREAKIVWMKHVQSIYFSKEISDLKSMGEVSSKSPLKSLNPRFNENKLLVVHGRLVHANIPQTNKYPIILPQKSHLSQLLIDRAHTVTLHGTIHLTLAHIRQEYWILNGRNAVKMYIHRCISCYRQKPQPMSQLMAPLPR